jgi:hypothetical protein
MTTDRALNMFKQPAPSEITLLTLRRFRYPG